MSYRLGPAFLLLWIDDLAQHLGLSCYLLSMLLLALTPFGPEPVPLPAEASPTTLFAAQPHAVYTALRTFGGCRFLCLGDHLRRLEESARRAGLGTPVDARAIRRALSHACSAWKAGEARVLVEVLEEPMPALHPLATVFVLLWPFEPPPPELYQQGVRVVSADPQVRRVDPRTKTSVWMADREQAIRDPTAFEHLLVDEKGRILEGFTTNFFGLLRGMVHTAEEGVLHGITRARLIEVFSGMGVPVRRDPVPLSEIGLLDEAGISSSSRALVPVVEIDGQRIGDGRPGPMMKAALATYEARLDAEARPAWPLEGPEAG